MPFKKFSKQTLQTSDLEEPKEILRVINTLQGSIADSISPLASKTQNDSTVLTNISLVAGQLNVINHTLNRKLIGWQVIRKRGSSIDIWDTQDDNLAPNLTLYLHTGTDVVVDLLVF